jgi:hypothetical protein
MSPRAYSIRAFAVLAISIAALACGSPRPKDGQSAPNLHSAGVSASDSLVQVEALAAAERGLATFRKLPDLHFFKNAPGQPAELSIGNAARVAMVRLDSLQLFTAGKDPATAIVPLGRMVYPVLNRGDAQSSITLDNQGGHWQVAEFGEFSASTIKAIAAQTSREGATFGSTTLVTIPALENLAFLSAGSGRELTLTAISSSTIAGVTAGASERASALFARLASVAKKYSGNAPQ